ncbi:MAG: TIM44-like domain-containing protein [Planctomycetota bacterium]|nr:TIM44-like domain-containing protein [Planctomycetota bacterium]
MDGNLANQAIATLLKSDAQFNFPQFSERVKTAFTKIQSAWSMQDLTRVRPFISDSIHERFSIQIEEQKTFGYRDRMDEVVVNSIGLAEVSSDEIFEVATLRIAARANDQRLSLMDDHVISSEPGPFVEFWSFLRRRGVATDPSKPGLIEGHCPNCGVVIEMNQSAKCNQCGALLRSGTFDWVLAEITQQSEWRGIRRADPPGAAELRKTDPGFNRIDLEDRASVMYWRKAMADRLGKIDPLRKIASEEFYSAYQTSLAVQVDGNRFFYSDCSVGSVNLLGILPGKDVDSAIVQVSWEGERMQSHAGGAPITTGQRAQVHNLYILCRKSGVTSDPGKSVSSAHCPSCGAPISSDITSTCQFCGNVMNDRATGWVLNAIRSAASDAGRSLILRLQDKISQPAPVNGKAAIAIAAMPVAYALNVAPSGLISWVVKTAAADGTIEIAEREYLEALAARNGVPPARLHRMIDMALAGALDVPDPPDQPTARAWLSAICEAAVADGTLQTQEVDLITQTARRFGFTTADLTLMLRQAKAQRFAAARDHLRAAATKAQ